MLQLSEEERDRISKDRYERARTIKGEGPAQTAQALEWLGESLQIKPTNTNALVLRAAIHTRTGAYEAALVDLNLAVQLESGPLANKRRLATIFGQRASLFLKMEGKEKEAIHDLRRAMDKEPDNGTWLYELGTVYMQKGNQLFAQQYFHAALHESLSEKVSHVVKYRCLVSLGICLLNRMECEQAIVSLTKAQEVNDTSVLRNILGLAYFRQKDYKTAAENFLRAIEMSPQVQIYHTHLGICYFRLGRYEDALLHLNEAIINDRTGNAQLRFLRGCVNAQLDMIPQALLEFEEAIRVDAQPRFFFARGAAFMKQNQLEDAQQCFTEALARYPAYRVCHIQLGIVAHLRGDLHKALSCFHVALEMQRDDAVLLERIGLVYADLNYHTTSIRFFDRCCRVEPQIGRYAFRKGVAQLNSGNPHGARESLAHAMDVLGYKEAHACLARSVAMRMLGNTAEAVRWSAMAIDRGGEKHPSVLMSKAYNEYLQGEYAACVATTKSVVKISDNIAESHYLAGQANYAMGKYSESTSDFRAAAALCPALAEDTTYCYALGVTLASQKLWQDALQWFDRAVNTSSDAASSVRVLSFHERAKTRQVLGDARGAADDFTVVLASQPRNFNALVRRSFALKELQRFEESSADWLLVRRLDTAGLTQQFDSKGLYKMKYVELCLPGEESAE